MWIDLATVIQNELSQKEENKNILTYIYMESMKNGIDELICKIETQTQRTNMDTKRGNGRDVMNWKIGVDI